MVAVQNVYGRSLKNGGVEYGWSGNMGRTSENGRAFRDIGRHLINRGQDVTGCVHILLPTPRAYKKKREELPFGNSSLEKNGGYLLSHGYAVPSA